jgi:hypothetical protein
MHRQHRSDWGCPLKIFKKVHRVDNATLTEVGLLLFIAQNVDASGLYQYADADTAEANNSTKTTINRFRNRLIKNGYLTVRIPRKWLGEKGWSTVGIAISPKGFKTLAHNSTMGQAIPLNQKPMDPDPFGSISIVNSKDSCDSNRVVESDSLDSLGIAAGESGGLALIRQLTAENILLIREIDYQQRLGAALDFVQSYDWSESNRDSLVIPIQPKVTGKPRPTVVPTGPPVAQLQTFRTWLVKGVGLVKGTSYADAEKNCRAEREAYLAKKCGEA